MSTLVTTPTISRIPQIFPACFILLVALILLAPVVALSADQPSTPTEIAAEQQALDTPVKTPAAPADVKPMIKALELLKGRSFKDKLQAIDLMADSGDPTALRYLKPLLEAHLYYRKSDKHIVIAKRNGRDYQLIEPENGTLLEVVKKKEIKKITINNAMRRLLREKIASLSLSNPDSAVRRAAVEEMITSRAQGLASTLGALIENEKDAEVKQLMQTGIALGVLDTGSSDEKIAAISQLSSSLNPAVKNRLEQLQGESEEKKISAAARKALVSIDGRVAFYNHLETLFFGLSLGSVLVLAAIGLAITFGVMGVINMAHGELIMLGAYTTYLIQQMMPESIGWALLLAVPAAFVVSGSVGILIERGIIRFLYGRPLETLLATFGVSLILQQLVRTVISPQNVPVSNPSWMSGSLQVNSVLSLTYNRLYIIAFSLIVFAALFLILKKTRLGLQVRAVSQNRAMARAMGVRSGRVDAMTFGLGSGIAGVAGVALSQLTNVGPNLGQSYIIDSFMVVVFGGVGSLMGTLVAGMSLGIANKLLEPSVGAVLAKILVLVFIILFIQKRPRGLFPQKGRGAEN
ncbi:MAG: urea ABC transporter permease subunit UrtB [bacterium]